MSHDHGYKFRLRGLVTALGALALGCDSPDVFLPLNQFGGGAGVIDGTLTYSGPLPCTEKQRIVGAAILLAFDVRLLPPPEGLGTSAASLEVVPGETLFSGVRSKLTFNSDGTRWCPAPDMPETVTVSADWAISPLPPSTYQVRGFYDLDGSFDPGFSIANLPTKGDIGGGAIDNAAAVLLGASPDFREITLEPSEKGTRVAGVAVTLGLQIPLDRPIFYPKAVTDNFGKNTDPTKVIMPSDFQLEFFQALPTTAILMKSEQSFLTITLGAGVPDAEVEDAQKSPFGFPVVKPPPPPMLGNFFFFSRQDVDRDDQINKNDVIPEGSLPALLPLPIFSRLADGSALVSQSTPAVILQGLNLWKPLNEMFDAIAADQTFEPTGADAVNPELRVAVRPAALCLHATDFTRPGLLVVTHRTDKAPEMHPILASEKGVIDALGEQFGREIELAYGCLPEGRYAMNLVYETGQAWTVPNEAGVCAEAEPASTDPSGKPLCGTRPRLDSQNVVFTIGPPNDPSYCDSAEDAQRIRDACSPIP